MKPMEIHVILYRILTWSKTININMTILIANKVYFVHTSCISRTLVKINSLIFDE